MRSSITRTAIRGSFIALIILCPALRAQVTVVNVTDTQIADGMKRLGVNLGSRNRWGDAQILKNLIDNPGFEAGHYGSVVLADTGSTATTFRQGLINSTAQPAGFWNGAEYEIVWGRAKGRTGTIRSFTQQGGRYVFELSNAGTAPGPLDVMLLRRHMPGIYGNTAFADTTTTRPGSPGRQSMKMMQGNARFDFYMDSYWRDGDRSAGKFLPVRGNWRAEVWAKGTAGGETLRLQFFREGVPAFIDRTATLTTEWKLYSWDVNVPANADPMQTPEPGEYRPILDVRLESGAGNEIRVDDISVMRTDDTNSTVFTDAFVQRLLELRPGIVRDWSTQLGASLDAQLAPPFGSGTNGSRSDGSTPGAYGYGLHEFLELAQLVGAEPWYVLPPTLSPVELANLMEYLAGPADGSHPYADLRAARGQQEPWTSAFTTIHLEYGNELWGSAQANDPFQGASLNGGVRLGAVASDRLGLLKASPYYNALRFNLIIGGQAGYSGRQQEIQQNATEHDAVALAPYFGVLDTWNSEEQIFRPLFATPFYEAGPAGGIRQSASYINQGSRNTELAIYEINFHTTHGSSPIDIRNDFLTGIAGGVALPLVMLTYQRDLQAVDQCAFTMLGYSFRIAQDQYARVWGLLRDLYGTGRKRPTWLGLEMVNAAIMPTSMVTRHEGDRPRWVQEPVNGIGTGTEMEEIHSFAYRDGHRRSAVLFNLSLTDSHTVELRVPVSPRATAQFTRLHAPGIHADNEDSVMVTIGGPTTENFVQGQQIALPPFSMTTVVWEDASVTGVDDETGMALALDVPSPRTPGAPVYYTIPRTGEVRLELVDLTGRTVARLAEGLKDAGRYMAEPAGPDNTRLAAGCYLLCLRHEGRMLTRGMIVVR